MSDDAVDLLLVEDNTQDLELTLREFASENLSQAIKVVRDGAEALDYLFCEGEYAHRSLGQTPKVVVLDLKLPKIDGFEVLRRVKSDPRTRSIPIVILTSSREERDIVGSYDLGAHSYVVKPIAFEQFSAAVRQVGVYWLRLNRTSD